MTVSPQPRREQGKPEPRRARLNFNPLEHPVCFKPSLRLAPSTWTGHVPFAMLLVDLLRPAVIVELGTYAGVSYCAFCQAVKELRIKARCYAIDTWEGDPQSGFYGPEVLAELKAHHDPLYGGFSRLIQSTFERAAAHFEEGTIDLLHVDGFHTYEEVKRDFEVWLPKMSRRGVILFHDINVREKDFGVWRFWAECKERFPSFEFVHSHGLGLAAVGSACPKSLQAFTAASEDEVQRLREFFFQLGQGLEAAFEARTLREAVKHYARLDEGWQGMEQQLRNDATALEEQQQRIRQVEQQLAEAGQQLEDAGQRLEDAEQQLAEKDQSLGVTQRQLQELEQQLDAASRAAAEAQRLAAENERLRQDLEQQLGARALEAERQLQELDTKLRADMEQHEAQAAENLREQRRRLEELEERLKEKEEQLRDTLVRLEEKERQLRENGQELYARDWLIREKEKQLELLSQPRGGANSGHTESPHASAQSQRTSPERFTGQPRSPNPSAEVEPAARTASGRAERDNGSLRKHTFKLVIGIVTFNNSPEQLDQLLKSIHLAVENCRELPVEVELFVIDNGEPTEWSEAQLPLARFDSRGNIGFGQAMNRLLAAAFADPVTEWFLCLNPDGVLHYKALRELLICSGQNPASLIEARQFPEEHLKPYDPQTLETPWASGACLLIRRDVYQQLGGFDPNFFMYLEDVDLSWRARAAGLTIKIAPNSLFGHEVLGRPPSHSTDKHLLLSGRYLAHKWSNPDFLRWAEEELVQRGYYPSLADLPALPQLNEEASTLKPELTDFAHYFHFSQARW